MEIAENLAYLLLLELLSAIVFVGLSLATVCGGEDHVVDELGNAGTVCVCQNFGDNALKKRFILKFDLLLVLIASSFFIFIIFRVMVLIGMFLFWFGPNKAIKICWRGIKFERRMILFEQLAHASTILYEINWYNASQHWKPLLRISMSIIYLNRSALFFLLRNRKFVKKLFFGIFLKKKESLLIYELEWPVFKHYGPEKTRLKSAEFRLYNNLKVMLGEGNKQNQLSDHSLCLDPDFS